MKKQYLAKRLFALILAVSVCAAAIPVPVRAEETTASQETDVSEETTASQETDVSEETAASEEETGQQDAFTLSEEQQDDPMPEMENDSPSAEVQTQEQAESAVVEVNGNQIKKSELVQKIEEATSLKINQPLEGPTVRLVGNGAEERIATKGVPHTENLSLKSGQYEVQFSTNFFDTKWEVKAILEMKVFYQVNFNVTGAPEGGVLVDGAESSTAKVYENQSLTFQTKAVSGYEVTVKNGEEVITPDENGNYTITPSANQEVSVIYQVKEAEGSKVTVEATENGKVTINGKEASEVIVPVGGQIVIEATPGNGYAVTAIAVNGEAKTPAFEERKGKVTLNAEEGQDYTVSVTFKKAQIAGKDDPTVSFYKGQKKEITLQKIFDAVVDGTNSVPDTLSLQDVTIQYKAGLTDLTWKEIDYIPGALEVTFHEFGEKATEGKPASEKVRIQYGGNEQYPGSKITKDITVTWEDSRPETLIEVRQDASMIYSSEDAEVKERLYQALQPVVKNSETGEIIETTAEDFTYQYEKMTVGTKSVTLTYKGNDAYKGSTVTANVLVEKADSYAIVNSQNITYGETFEPVFSSSPLDANVIGIIAGADSSMGGYLSLEASSITLNDLAGTEIPVIGTTSLQKFITDMYGDEFKIRQLTDVIQKIANLIPEGGNLGEILDGINQAITIIDQVAPGILDTKVVLGKTPEKAGIYTAIGITANANYKTSVNVGILTVSPKTTNLKLKFCQELPENGKIKYTEAKEFQFGAQLYDEEKPVESNLQMLYTGVKWNGQPVVSSEPILEPGTYIESACVLNGDYAVAPISRKYLVEREETVLKFEQRKLTATYDGKEHPLKAVIYGEDGKPIEGVEPTVIYTNIKTGLDVTTQAPVDAGNYMATAFFAGNEQYKPSKITAENLFGTVKIKRVEYAEVQICDLTTTYGDLTELTPVYGETYVVTDERIPEKDRDGILKELHCTDSTHPAGTHEIAGTLRDGLNGNYKHIEVLPGTHTVKPYEVTIWPSAVSKYEGEEDPELTWNCEATLPNGETLASLGDIILTRESGEEAGTYDIFLSDESKINANYQVTLINGEDKFEIKPGHKTIILNFVDESGNPVLSTDIKVESDTTYFHTSLIQDKVPSSWELKDVGDIAIAEDNTATVVLREKAHTKDVTVNYVTEDGENVGTESVTVEKDYDYIETSWLKEVPEYYEIVEPGKVTIGEDNTAEVVVRKTMKNVIVNFVDESGNPVLSTDIKVESDATYFHTSLIQDKIPSGWELKDVGDVAIVGNTATVVLREKAHTKDVTVNYVTEDGENVGTESVTVEKDYDYIETSWLKEVPEYYEIVEPGKVTIGEDNTAEVVVRKTMKNVIVNFVDESGNPVLSTDIKVESDATYFHTSLIQDKIPSGWELKDVGDVAIVGNTATVVLREKAHTKDVTVNYVTEDGENVGTESVTVEKDYDYIETSWLKEVPEYYEIVEPGKVTIGEDNTAEVVVRKTMKNVIVNFVDESGNPVLSTDIKVESDATYFHTSLIQDKIPSGWELKDVGDVAIVGNTATVVLREKAHTKDVTVNYVTEDGENVGTESVTVEKDYDYIETSWLKEVPEYYEIVEPGKVTIGEDNTAEVVVRKTMKNVIVNFVDESGNLVFSTDIEVESDATYFHTSLIQDKIPSGWELKEVGDIAIAEDNTATVVLRASKKPEEPNKPEEPDKPEKPEKPNKPENPDKPSDSDRPSESEKPSDSHKVPMTGDQSPVGMAALGLLASMGLLISRKRK